MNSLKQSIQAQIEGILATDRLAVTRGISWIENEREGWEDLLSGLYHSTGRAYRIGITGPPGAGKSTITQKLIERYRIAGLKVAVVAVDPTSPFTGGAILGDRVRMQSETLHPDVFIRSMATRGSLGGLSMKAQDVADLLDAAGFDIVIMETVGVGQSELDIANATDTTVVVLVPESGDAIQAMKSGLMEIADIFVLNKSDRDGADQAVTALKTILTFRITHAEDEWVPDVVKTIGTTAEGLDKLVEGIARHREHMTRLGILTTRRADREMARVRQLVDRLLQRSFWNERTLKAFERDVPALLKRKTSPLQMARGLIEESTVIHSDAASVQP